MKRSYSGVPEIFQMLQLYGFVDRFQLNDPNIQYTYLTCGFQDLAFEDSTFAIASGY